MISKYLLHTNIWVSICFTALVVFFQLNLYEPKYSVWGIAFFGTLAIYNFTRIGNWKKISRSELKNPLPILLTVIGCLGTFICVIIRGFEIKTFMYLGVLGFISFCYSLPFSGLGLRTIPFLKLFLIAFVWAGSSIGLLLIVHHSFIENQFLFFSVFFYVVGITIPFDIRDSKTDQSALKTIPQVMGISPSKILALGCLILSGILCYLEIQKWDALTISWMLCLSISFILVLNASPKRKEQYYSFWIEGCSLLPLLFYLILTYFQSN